MSKIYVDEIAGIASPSTVAIPGHVIQVVQTTYSTPVNIVNGTFAHTGLTASITPSSTSSKILVIVESPVRLYRDAGAGLSAHCQLYRNGASVISDRIYTGYDNGDAWYDAFTVSIHHLDSPSSTTAVEYKLYARASAATLNPEVYFQHGDGTSSMTLMEIAG